MNDGILAALEIANAALLLVEQASREGRDVTPEELAAMSGRLGTKLAAFEAKLG